MKKIAFLIGLLFVTNTAMANNVWYIDPQNGSDENSGKTASEAWKDFSKLNETILEAGDIVEILSDGNFYHTLKPQVNGNAQNPVKIRFAEGNYNFFPDRQYSEKFQISNTNDAPDSPKRCAIMLENGANLIIEGNSSRLIMRGKMIELVSRNFSNLKITGVAFDYLRPTISEFEAVKVNGSSAQIRLNKDSWYEIRDNKLFWIGEGWEEAAGSYTQELNVSTGRFLRSGNPLANYISAREIEKGLVELNFFGNANLTVNNHYTTRNTFRDYCGMFLERSSDITFEDMQINYMHGMGVVSQFSKNITFRNVQIAPTEESKRICTGWADLLHFSGCGGKITVEKVLFSGANDDAINVHGTHLQAVWARGNRVKARFKHNQTFGFNAFAPGDEIAFVNKFSLLPKQESYTVEKSELVGKREIILTLDRNVKRFSISDVIENITWAADVEVRDSIVKNIPTRGFLLSSRGKIIIENNFFDKTGMSGILVADDARSWYESGIVTDLTIRGNTFEKCGSPAINFAPENISHRGFIHTGIRIIGNRFVLDGGLGLWIKSTKIDIFADNVFELNNGKLYDGKNFIIQKEENNQKK